MPMAMYAKADVILVADIDRGGVFASVYGSIMLMTEEERQRVKGIIINKFRGDIELFKEGVKIIEDLCHVPVLGVVPYFTDIHIEEEDSVSLSQKSKVKSLNSKVNVAVVLLRHMSNFTDFDVLEQDERVHLYYTNNPADIEEADIIILPGSKSTIDDLYHLRRNGMAEAIVKAHRRGTTVLGICGGYQMMGQSVEDPDGIEGDITNMPGLGLLPIHTTITKEKTTRQVTFEFNGQKCQGYEIHQGVSDTDEAILMADHCIGTYIHGILDNAPFVDYLLRPYADKVNTEESFDYQAFKEQQYDRLADYLRRYVDIPAVYRILGNKV